MADRTRLSYLLVPACCILLLAACAPAVHTPTEQQPTMQPPPRILAVEPVSTEVPRYEELELVVALEATYDSPYDVRQVDLTAVFSGPDGREWSVPGFWDGEEAWRVRFTPSAEGEWRYRLQVRDQSGASEPYEGQFTCLPSDKHGWLLVGNRVDPAYSARYLAHHDGTPFYGVGHCDAFDLMFYGWDQDRGFTLFDRMVEHGENMLVYWPVYSNPFFATRYDRYSAPGLKVIDLIVEDAARKGIYLVFTVWDHGMLRDKTHSWSRRQPGLWETQNGFRELGSLDSFFTDEEAWAWQENLYRYFIARWGYSPAVGMWQTVSEIDGTNAGSHTDSWHERVNRYFAGHDPYRHPTTASKSGNVWWPSGFAVMDVSQMHTYGPKDDATGTAAFVADWTQRMWQAEDRPSFAGEFGTPNQRAYPELLHSGIWAALATGAAATPMEWNDSSAWGSMDDEMLDQMAHLATFVSDLPLVRLNPAPLDVTVGSEGLRVWGMAGGEIAFFWVQDLNPGEIRTDVAVAVTGLTPGAYIVHPYDTWQGVYLAESEATAGETGRLTIVLPPFSRDIAVRLERRQ